MIVLDCDLIKQLSDAARSANDSITDATNILNQIPAHNEWGCREKNAINEFTMRNKNKIKEIQTTSSLFLSKLDEISQNFVKAEATLGSKFSSVDKIIGAVISSSGGIYKAASGIINRNWSSTFVSDIMKDVSEFFKKNPVYTVFPASMPIVKKGISSIIESADLSEKIPMRILPDTNSPISICKFDSVLD